MYTKFFGPQLPYIQPVLCSPVQGSRYRASNILLLTQNNAFCSHVIHIYNQVTLSCAKLSLMNRYCQRVSQPI
jgi:hypothetical protein